MPIEAPAVAALATDPHRGQGAQAYALIGRFLGADVAINKADERIKQALGLAQTDRLGPLLGNDLVAAQTKDGPLAAWVVKDEPALRTILRRFAKAPSASGYERYTHASEAVAVKGPLVVAGAPAAVQTALADRARGAGMTPRLFTERLRGLPADALLRVEGNLALVARVQRSSLPWIRSLNRFALTVRADDGGLHARLRAAGVPTTTDQLPLAAGATPPAPLQRSNGATVGIRDLRQTIRFALAHIKTSDPGTYRRYELARRGLKLFGRGDIDRDVIDQLSGTATIWTPDLKTFTVSARVADAGRMAHALGGLRALIDRLLVAVHLPGARYGVTGDTLVITTDPATSLARLAAGSPQRIGSLTGALTGVVRGQALGQALIDRLQLPPIASLALGALGDTTFAVRIEPTGVEASADTVIKS